MKKIKILILILILFPMGICARREEVTTSDIDFKEAQKIIKEVMKSYYIKGDKIQYNYARAKYGEESPEDATSQNTLYTVCAGYTTNVYQEAFGMREKNYINSSEYYYPLYNTDIIKEAKKFYDDNKNNLNSLNNNFLIYYEKPKTSERYIYSKSNSDVSVSDFAELLQPGDLLTYSGHALIVYDVFTNSNKKDAIILNATQLPFIYTRINGTNRISQNMFKNSYGKNGIIDVDKEGTVKYLYLSNLAEFVSNDKISCSKTECVVIRPFYNDNGKTSFNYYIDTDKYKKSQLRLEYPGLDIDKTVNEGDNNSVVLGTKLTYTIKITNKSNVSTSDGSSDAKNYSKFYIEESIDENKVKFDSATNGGKYNKETGKVTWEVSSLSVGATKELEYTVEIKENTNNIGTTVISSGKFYKNSNTSIPLAKINNVIVANKKNVFTISTASSDAQVYEYCYNHSTNTGLKLINEVIKCATGNKLDLNLSTSDLNSLIIKAPSKNDQGKWNERKLKEAVSLSNDSSLLKYRKMILNNYWGGTNYLVDDDYLYLVLPRWVGATASTRAETINPKDFKDGDILIYKIDYSCDSNNIPYYPDVPAKNTDSTTCNGIYTDKYTTENGLYAYIYINGKFVGINGSGATARNDFTYKYYNGNSTTIYNGKTYAETNNLYGSSKNPGYTNLLNKVKSDEISYEQFTDIMNYINYQTLFEKDYYVILRPEYLMKYVVKYNSNNGEKEVNAQTITYDVSTPLSPNEFKKTGYEFNDWNTKANGSGNSYSDKVNVKNLVTNDDGIVNLYAQWSPITYSIKFNSNGGTGNMSNKSMTYDISSKLTANSFTRAGYKFIEWNTKADGSGDSYIDESSVKNLTSNSKQEVDLYAIWEELYSYIVDEKYSFNNEKKIIGRISNKTLLKDFESKITLNDKYSISTDYKTINKNNYIYTGGKATIYKNDKVYDELTTVVIGDITGDGLINISDIAKLYRHLRKKITLDEYYIEAGNVVDTDDKITIGDVAKLYRYLRNKIDSL